MDRLLGLIGYPLGHSFSPAYFASKFVQLGLEGWDYRLFPFADLQDFPKLLRDHPQLIGLNVTVPHKEKIIPFLDDIDPVAAQIGAVNTIRVREGQTFGSNTDAPAFRRVLSEIPGINPSDSALVLGSGGGSKAVCAALDQAGIAYQVVSRQPVEDRIGYADIDAALLEAHRLIIQATPLGMHPHPEGLPPLPWDGIGASHVLIDLVYNPQKTRFLEEGEKRGATILNGLRMLYLQAEFSWSVWTENVELWKTTS